MGIFDFIGTPKQTRMQLYHWPNGDLEFIKRDIVGESLTEFDGEKQPIRSWIDKFKTQYDFDGYRSIPAGPVQLAYDRHYFLEIHDILDDAERPPETGDLDDPFMTAIAEARCVEVTKCAKVRSIYEKMTWILGSGLMLEIIVWAIAYAAK